MSLIPNELLYTSDHEWVRYEGEECVIVITDHAQDSLGDVTFVELPAVGDRFGEKAVFGVVESVKAASDVYSPVNGEVVEGNEALADAPENINDSPYDDGWICKIKLADAGDLAGAVAEMQPATRRPTRVRDHHLRQWYVLADLHDRAGDRSGALRWFEAVAAGDPSFADVADRLRTLGRQRRR